MRIFYLHFGVLKPYFIFIGVNEASSPSMACGEAQRVNFNAKFCYYSILYFKRDLKEILRLERENELRSIFLFSYTKFCYSLFNIFERKR
jgi:hypothetical protein